MQHNNNNEALVSKFQRLDLFRDNPVAQAIVTKLVPSTNGRAGNDKKTLLLTNRPWNALVKWWHLTSTMPAT